MSTAGARTRFPASTSSTLVPTLPPPRGRPFYAAASGYVQVAGWSSGGYGNYVIIYHGKMSDGVAYSTLYGHMRSVATSAGKYVKQGEIIGYVGSTGNSTGNHLHLEVWRGGSKANAVNPPRLYPHEIKEAIWRL